MRAGTLFFSAIVHITSAVVLVVARLAATDALPEPPRRMAYIEIAPAVPSVPPRPVRPAAVVAKPAVAPAPTEAAAGIRPEQSPAALDDPMPPMPGGIVIGSLDASPLPIETPPPRPVATPAVRVGGDIRPPEKLVHVAPVYPAVARVARIEGVVILETVIAPEGAVSDVRVLRSVPLLDEAAVDAVRRWRFTPTLLNGEPVAVVMTVTVAFTLR